jgi:hypothetical protein
MYEIFQNFLNFISLNARYIHDESIYIYDTFPSQNLLYQIYILFFKE